MNADPTLPAQEPIPAFDWAIYVDATLAGLSVLIPLPLVDAGFEAFFRRRIPGAIARRRQHLLAPTAVEAINTYSSGWTTMAYGCLTWPFRFVLELLLQLFRKLLYFMTVKRAVDALNYYWQRAFLLDYMVRHGYLDDPAQVDRAVGALEMVLADSAVSPLRQLARQILWSPLRLVRMLRRARQGQEDATLDATRSRMAQMWSHFDGYWAGLIQRFEERYHVVDG